MKYLFILLLALPLFLFGQNDNCQVRISLLTATPGDELYSTFGHSALRVTDSVSNTDIVYNYGTFNFDEPGFYTKFIRGKLMYFLSREYFESFRNAYQQENRGLTEQVLNLNCNEKETIISLLNQNLLPQNLYYQYDFLFDNCTTRLRDLVEAGTGDSAKFGEVLSSPKTFRNLIHEYLNYNDKQWSKLGIDILLGSKTDAVMAPREVMFLPDYLLKSFDNSTIASRPLVNNKQSLYEFTDAGAEKNNLTHPFFIFLCLFILVAFMSFSKNAGIQNILRTMDAALFFITGLLGFLLLFMWFGTDHLMCKNNYNLLWAWPLHTIAAFFIHSEKKWIRYYFLGYAIAGLILAGFWFALPQQMSIALLPVLGILILRSFLLVKKK